MKIPVRFILLTLITTQLFGCYYKGGEYEKFAIEKPEPEKAIAKEESPERKIVIEIQHDPSAGVVAAQPAETKAATSCKPVVKKKTKKKVRKKDTSAVAACG